MIHLVTYDLKTPNDRPEDYERIIHAIQAEFPDWCHIEQSVWLIHTEIGTANVRENLKAYLHDSDVLFVARLSGAWASRNLGPERSKWVKERTF